MIAFRHSPLRWAALSALVVVFLWTPAGPVLRASDGPGALPCLDEDKDDKASKRSRKKRKKRPHYWGRRPKESLKKYKRRKSRMIKRCKKDELDMYSYQHRNFLIRTDISEEFTVELALYVEELHRAYSSAFSKMGAPPSKLRDLVEVVCYKDRQRYIDEGGGENSGGHFHPMAKADPKYWSRPDNWPAGQFRLMMFTDGEEEFDKWEKSTMKHEAAHMELQLRLGYTALDAPRWWNEGMAACFEWWDFDKSVEENFELIPKRGRYAPFIRRLWATERWKDFEYIWTIDGASWHRDMATPQGYLNYCQAWSLAAFMFNQGVEGKKFFNQLFNLTIRMGADHAISYTGTRKRGWEVAFPLEERMELEEAWLAWVKEHLPKDGRNRGEAMDMLKRGFDPDADKLVPLSPEALAERLAAMKEGEEAAETKAPGAAED